MLLHTALALSLVLPVASMAAEETVSEMRAKAMRRDYTAQRNVAFCLRTGDCPGAAVPKMMESCAWRMVVLGSGNREVDSSDIANYRLGCFSLISQQERAIALRQAETLFQEIYGRPLPLETLLRD